ncbi:hypothetical protein C8R45DRAFT_931082 [Mycena sanguinolenta]|nr:hypothetical protein C8R45DRAFT_931082 [Mycena sanguinolenta]
MSELEALLARLPGASLQTSNKFRGLRKGIKPHVNDDQWRRFEGFLDLMTREDVQIFSDWVFSLKIPQVTAWWQHKLNHKWILPGLLECLSGLTHEDWLTTPFTSNGNETQHHWTNSQTGIDLSAKEAAAADHAVGKEFEASLASGVLANFRNDLSHRTDRSVKRHTSAVEKTKRTQAGTQKSRSSRFLWRSRSKFQTNSSGVVRVRQKSKSSALSAILKGKGPIGGKAKGKGKQPQRTEGNIEPDDTDVFEDPSLSVEPFQFIDPPQLNFGATESPVVSLAAMEFEGNPDAGQYTNAVEAVADSAASSSEAPASARRSSRKRAASAVHSEAPPSKVMSAESGVLGSGKAESNSPIAFEFHSTVVQLKSSFLIPFVPAAFFASAV